MSYFYIQPAKGDMHIHLLEEIIVKRVEYLQTLTRGDTPSYSEYVIEGSVHDNVGHFVLCLIAALMKSTDFTQFFVKAELFLFEQRISALSAYDLRCFVKKLLQIMRKQDCNFAFLEPLQKLCRYLLIKNIASHVCSPTHSENCTVHGMKIYFKQCLSFVAKRQVEVTKGFASLPCGRWIQYLSLLFKTGLLLRISQSSQYFYENDPRMADLMLIVKKIHPLKKFPNMQALLSKDIDKSSRYFPPCMQNLHQHLRTKHRLSHNHRFYYSLFLKDIGMPVEEAINFWKSEYSITPNGSHRCVHNWAKDERKIVYGIRHMYGLEGGRKKYGSKNCLSIQNTDNSCQEGGCPFKSFGDTNMLQTLGLGLLEPLSGKIFDYKRKKLYTSACLLYLQQTFKTDKICDNMDANFSPVKYYTLAYELLK